MPVEGLPVAVEGCLFEAAAREVFGLPAFGEGGQGELLGFAVAVAFDVDEPAAKFFVGPLPVPGGFFAQGFEDAPAGGVSVADPPGDATWALVAPHTAPFRVGSGCHWLIHKLNPARNASRD
jgi:hypothetical protein